MKSDLIYDGPPGSSLLFIFAHGAGAPMDSDFMNEVASGLGTNGIRVCRFEFEYMKKRREEGRRRGPDPARKLEERFRAVLEQVRGDASRIAIGGKSMGGRIASMIADESEVDRLICLGYPFHPPGKPEQTRTAHLKDLSTPTLILQGERDPFGRLEEVAGYSLSSTIRIEWLEDGDHSFKPRKKSGTTLKENISRSVELITDFLN